MKFRLIILKVIISFISFIISFTIEAATRGVLQKKVFFKMLQNSQGNTCAKVSFVTFLRTVSFTEHLRTYASVTT